METLTMVIYLMLEQDSTGDGFQGAYYDNEGFFGEAKLNHETNLYFSWEGQSPLEGINNENFSVMYFF